MEKRLLIAAGLSLAVLILWDVVVPKPRRQPPPAAPASPTSAAAPAVSPSASAAAAPSAEAAPIPPASASEELRTVVENDVMKITLSNRGAVASSIVLKRYKDEQGNPLELVRAVPGAPSRPLALDFPGQPDRTAKAAQALYAVDRVGDRGVRLRFSEGPVQVQKEILLSDGYLFDVKVSAPGAPYTLVVAAGLRNPTDAELASRYVMPATGVATSGGGLEKVRAEKLSKPVSVPMPANGFAGIEDNYFLAVLLPSRETEAVLWAVTSSDAAGKKQTTLAAGIAGNGDASARGYYGPKDVETLESFKLGLERTVDFGWFGVLARPLLWLLKKTYATVGNWGVAILLVTLLIRVALFPLMHKSYVSMKKMQKLAPKMNAIRDKYKKAKTDAAQRAKMNQELMALYQAEGYNPMSGCLPILLQLPILVAFYNVLSRAIELRHAPFALWIRDLSAVDHTYVLLILMIVSMYVQQAMTPSTADPAQKKIFMAMPLLWGFFLKDMPSGLVLYWLFSNLLTIGQQVLINRLVRDEPAAEPADRRKARVAKVKGAGR